MAKVENFKVVLGPYKGLKVRKPDAAVSEAELEAVCLREQKNFAQKVDVEGRDVKLGDIAVIDFTGYCDGVAFEGGAGTDYPLEIGSGTFIPGFEEQIVGASVGSSVDVNVTFPEDYGAPNLAGKPSLFKVTVKKIMEYHYPVLEDTVKADIKQKLVAQKAAKVEETYENALIDAIIGESEIEVTDEALKLELDNLLKEWKAVMHMNQINVDQYYSMTGMNDDKMKAQLRQQAELRLRSRLVLEAIAQTEGLDASEIEVEQQISKLAEQYNMDRAQAKEKLGSEHIDALKSDIRMHKALNLVKENAVNVAE